MRIKDITTSIQDGQLKHLLDADAVIIPSNINGHDYLVASKVYELLEKAWEVIHDHNVSVGNIKQGDHDASAKALSKAFSRWLEDSEVYEEDIKA